MKEEKRTDIRKQAKEVLKGKTIDLKKLSSGDAQNLVHELELHQVELEMQNEELRRVQNELEDTRNRYSDLYDFAPIGYFTLDGNGLILEVNLTGAKKLGRERAYLIKKPFSLYVVPDYKDAFYSHLRQVFDIKTQTTCELRIVDNKGTIFDALLESIPMHDSDGNLLARTMMSDITQRKLAEAELKQLIEKEHEARTEVQAARKLDSMKSMFIASTSHELRTPLNSIIGFTSLILDGTSGKLNPDQKEQLEIVHTCGKHLLSLINDILDLSNIESGRIRVEVCEFNLKQIVDEAVTNLNVILNEKKLELKVDVGDINMKSDRKRIVQCLTNLISNGIKYTEKGSVEISAKNIDNNVELSVTDTGIGIETQDIPKLFAPFVRLHTPLTYRTSGTGLGLYLVKKLAVDFLGGDVGVKSEFGKGSIFTLRVPVELEGHSMKN